MSISRCITHKALAYGGYLCFFQAFAQSDEKTRCAQKDTNANTNIYIKATLPISKVLQIVYL